MLKLYKNINGALHYWETWDKDKKASVVHWGIVGETGQNKEVKSSLFKDFHKIIQNEILHKSSEGFAPIDEDDLDYLVIEYKIASEFGNDKDLEKRYKLQNKMDEILGWTGLGHCDGGSIGSGTMEVACLVCDFEIAKKVIAKELEKTEFSDYSRIYNYSVED